jgi:hypothetical protein
MSHMPQPDLPKYFKLRKMGDSLYITVPKEFVRAHTLNPHDDGLWFPSSDGVLLKFDRVHGLSLPSMGDQCEEAAA